MINSLVIRSITTWLVFVSLSQKYAYASINWYANGNSYMYYVIFIVIGGRVTGIYVDNFWEGGGDNDIVKLGREWISLGRRKICFNADIPGEGQTVSFGGKGGMGCLPPSLNEPQGSRNEYLHEISF